MEIFVIILVGLVVGVFGALRLVRSLWAMIVIIGSIFATIALLLVKPSEIRSLGDLRQAGVGVFLYGSGIMFYLVAAVGFAWGITALIRRACVPGLSKSQRPVVKLRFTYLGALCFGLSYFVCDLGTILNSRGSDLVMTLEGALPNVPILWLTMMFGLLDAIKANSSVEAVYFTMAGTVLYAALGGAAGFALDLLKQPPQPSA